MPRSRKPIRNCNGFKPTYRLSAMKKRALEKEKEADIQALRNEKKGFGKREGSPLAANLQLTQNLTRQKEQKRQAHPEKPKRAGSARQGRYATRQPLCCCCQMCRRTIRQAFSTRDGDACLAKCIRYLSDSQPAPSENTHTGHSGFPGNPQGTITGNPLFGRLGFGPDSPGEKTRPWLSCTHTVHSDDIPISQAKEKPKEGVAFPERFAIPKRENRSSQLSRLFTTE